MAFEKLYNEIYAIVTLKYFWKPYQPGFVKSESPDWLNPALGMGLEISQALFQADGETQQFVDQYLGKRREEIPGTALARYGGRLYFYNGRMWAVTPEQNMAPEGHFAHKTLCRFQAKLEKLNAHYQLMEQNALYLYVHSGNVTRSDIEDLFTSMRDLQARRAQGFQMVFLNCVNTLYALDFSAGRQRAVQMPEGALIFMQNETENLRHICPWQDGELFSRAEALAACEEADDVIEIDAKAGGEKK